MIYIIIIIIIQILFVIDIWLTNKALDDLQDQINELKEDQIYHSNINLAKFISIDKEINKFEYNKDEK